MIKWVGVFVVCFLVLGCDHPEKKAHERKRGGLSPYNGFIESTSDYEIPLTNTYEDFEYEYRNVLFMERESGVRYVWIEINGLRLRFVFDTGASNICISPAEATVLYRQGTLSSDDFLEIEYFQDATGTISEGMTINLREVKIGDVVLRDVKALVVDSVDAPLLLGQSVLERFGTIEINNDRDEIIFK